MRKALEITWPAIVLACALPSLAPPARAQPEAGDPAPWTPLPPVVFFPPTPPVYGAAVEEKAAGRSMFYHNRLMTPPDGMADFVGETFYPALSTRLFAPDLSRAMEKRIHAYRAKRRAHVNALLNEMVKLRNASPDERLAGLRVFAVEQSPQLASLEAEAEQLRDDLVNSGFWNRVDWNHERRWRIGAISSRQSWAEKEAEFQVIRAAAFYERGFSVQQRGLLREIAVDLHPLARRARGLPARTDSDAMFFSPEMARFRLPPHLPAPLREKIASFNGRKAALKRELREAVLANDAATPTRRAEVFAALAERQWPELQSLEHIAEEIRAGLGSALEPVSPPPPPWLPAGLLAEIRAFNEDREAYFREMQARMEEAADALPRPDFNGSSDERLQRQAEHAAAVAQMRRRAALQFQEENATRFAALQQRYKTIRDILTTIAEKQFDPKTGKPLDADGLLQQHVASMQRFETFGRESTIYTNYRVAMLQPGLSPEQRRLLFGNALIGLAQPLPYGEVIPRRAATQPYPTW